MNLTVWECMEMLGVYTKVRVRNAEIALVDEPFNLYDYKFARIVKHSLWIRVLW